MTRYQLLLLPTLAAVILVVGGALNQSPPAPKPPVSIDGAVITDPAALQRLDRAIAALTPQNTPWIETKVWQQVLCDDFAYQAAGRLITAPGDRLRFDLNVKVGNTLGELRMVNDGKAIWQSIRMGSEPAVLQKWQLPAPADAAARAKLLDEHGFRGVSPMLRDLRQRVQSAQVFQGRWHGIEVDIVSGIWPVNAAPAALAGDVIPQRLQMRQCFVYLDAQTSWPHRIEWWGGEKSSNANQLLMQTEFRNPVLNQPLSAQRCEAEFMVQGGQRGMAAP